MKKSDIPKPILERVEAELLSGEDLLWVGQPHPARFLLSAANKTHPLLATIVGLEIALMLVTTLVSSFLLAGILLFALITTAIFGGIGQQIYSTRNTIYAITNQRAISIKGNEVETFGKADLQSIVKKTNSNGRGDIIFGKDSEKRITPSAFGLMLYSQEEKERGFFGIENPQQVELLLLDRFGDTERDTRRLEVRDEELEDYDYPQEYQAMKNQQ